jgi:uncharacterized damage-inducible protein DinB
VTTTSDPRDLIDAFEEQRRLLLDSIRAVPPEMRKEPFVGKWSLHEVVAHLIGWDRTNVSTVDSILAGQLPAFYERFEPNWESFNDDLVAQNDNEDWDELMTALEASQAAALARLRALPPEALTRPGPVWRTRQVTIAGVIRSATRDEHEHLGQVRGLLAGEAK